jgi:hypothetical protein
VDIRQALASVHSKENALAIVDYIGDDTKRFAELMSIFFEGIYRLTQRAAWPMNTCAERHPELIRPFLPKLVDLLKSDDNHDAVKRNIVRLLQFVDIPPRLAGKVYSHCLDLINDPNEPIAVRVFSITVAAKIAHTKPDLMNELRLVVRENLPHSSAAFRVRAREVLEPNRHGHRK